MAFLPPLVLSTLSSNSDKKDPLPIDPPLHLMEARMIHDKEVLLNNTSTTLPGELTINKGK